MLLKFLVVLFALNCLTNAVVRFKMNQHEGKGYKLLKEGRLTEYGKWKQERNLKKTYAILKNQGKSRIYDYEDYIYSVNITIGTPMKQFKMMIDTAVAFTWVLDVAVDNPMYDDDPPNHYCERRSCFNQSESSTYKKDGRTYSGTNSFGYLGIDQIGLGDKDSQGAIIKDVTFGQTTSEDYAGTEQYDGVLGLAFQSVDVLNTVPVFQQAINQKLFDQPIFTFYLKPQRSNDEDSIGGQLTWGALDSEHCSSDVKYVPLINKTYFSFNVDGFSVNKQRKTGKWIGIADTSTAMIRLTKSILDVIVKETNGEYDSSYALYQVDCNTKIQFSITINGQTLTIDESIIVFKPVGSRFCYMAFEEWYWDNVDIVLGDTFIRKYCQVYDLNGRVGFAESLKN